MNYKIIGFTVHGCERGSLVALETHKEIPFEVKRIYYMWDTAAEMVRGRHAHKKLKQILICTSGQCTIILDDGEHRKEVILNSPTQGLLIEANMWREMKDFSEGAVLMVLASELYDESDYIRNYDEFLQEIQK